MIYLLRLLQINVTIRTVTSKFILIIQLLTGNIWRYNMVTNNIEIDVFQSELNKNIKLEYIGK